MSNCSEWFLSSQVLPSPSKKRPQSAPARRASKEGKFVPSSPHTTVLKPAAMHYIFDPYDEKKKLFATTSTRSLSRKLQEEE
jgi:hypothetical protein